MVTLNHHAGPPPIRLGIVHFFVWITTCALVLTGYKLLNDPADFAADERAFSSAFQLVMSIGYSLALTALGVLIVRRWQGDLRFPTHAGHWLVIVGVIAMAIDGGSLAVVKLYAARSGLPWKEYWPEYQATAWSLGTLAGLALLVLVRQELYWRLVVLGIVAFTSLHAIEHVADATGQRLWTLYRWHDAIALSILGLGILSVILASGIDLSTRVKRDWLHWSGVAAWLGLATMQVAMIVNERLKE